MENKLKTIRKKKGLTLTQASRLIRVSPTTIWRYENNKRTPSVNIAQRISKVYKEPINKLF